MRLKKILQLFTAALCFATIIQVPVSTFAYDKQTYKYDQDEECYLVDNSANKTTDNRMTLYVLVPKMATLEGEFCYTFKCTSNNFKDSDYYSSFGYDGVGYKTRFDTCTQLNEIVGTGQVVAFKFNIENGTYIFSTNDSTDTVTLTPDLKNPMDTPINYMSQDEIRASIKNYPVSLTNTSTNLYAIYGDGDFISANAKAFGEYAAGKKNTSGVSTSNDSEKVQIAKSLDSLTDDKTTKNELNEIADELLQEDAADIKYSNIDVNKQATTNGNVSITKTTETTPTENTRSLKITDILLIIGGIIVLFVIIKLIKKKK